MTKGIDQAESQFRSYSSTPRLRLQAGDRARLHFLSTGYDELFAGGRFHELEPAQGETYGRSVLCVRTFTDGEEVCSFCEEGHDDFSNRFAVWILVHCIYHNGDNPDPEGLPWEQFKLSGRIVFKESIETPILIWLKAGKQKIWFLQFKSFAAKYGTLEGRLFEFRRAGAGRDDTDYTLAAVKEEKLSKKIEAEAKEGLATVEAIFRSTVGGGSWLPPRLVEGEEELPVDEAIPVTEEDLPSVEEAAEELV